jgi:tetratricopeptide (TPR) repeat protein
MKAYKAEQLVMLQNQKPTKFPSDQDLDTQKTAQLRQEREDAARAASERARMEQIEAARLADLLAKQNAMSQKEREARKDQAAKLGAEGMALYSKEDFAAARAKFDQAISLDPDNHVFFYQYGVSLYKVEDYNRALVFLALATGPSVNPAEKNYFMALTHMKLKEPDAALKSFDDVIATKNPSMAPSAQFYKGAIYFEQEKFDEAQASFQSVLDTSSDTKLDERAESFIEQILRSRQAAEERKHKWSVTGAIGEMYDSNVLLSATSQTDSGIATSSAGWRTLLTGSLRYRPVYDETHELAAQVDLLTLYTLDKTFAIDQSLRNADPTVVTLTMPWTHKGTWLTKGHKLDITPGYETTIMSVEANTSKVIIMSPLLTVSNLLVMNDKWFNNVTLGMRDDISKLDSSIGDSDASALQFRLGTSNLLFMNDKKDTILIPEAALTTNQAAGRNASYNRFDLAVGYLMPSRWATTSNFKLGYFYLDYPQKLPAQRADNSYTVTYGVSKKINDIWNAGFLGSYNINKSNEDTSAYNKFTALLTLSAAYGF